MYTGDYCSRKTYSKEWRYLDEGGVHMIFVNNHCETDNIFQDQILYIEKTGADGPIVKDNNTNEIISKVYNKWILGYEKFSKFLVKEKLCEIEEGETKKEFIDNLIQESDTKRPEKRKTAYITVDSPFSITKNLFYLSPKLKAHFKDNEAQACFIEIKPRAYFDEIPSFEEINEHLKSLEKGKNIDPQYFYNKYFKDCPPSERKFIYRRTVADNHKVLKLRNTSDFFSKHPLIRSKNIKAFFKENWGSDFKFYDSNMKVIKQPQVMSFFTQWDPNITIKTISELIARAFDMELVRLVKGLQGSFDFYADKQNTINENFANIEKTITEARVEKIFEEILKAWKENKKIDLDGLAIQLGYKEYYDLQVTICFQIRQTFADSSFVMRCAISKKTKKFDIQEEWEKGDKSIQDKTAKLKVEFISTVTEESKSDEESLTEKVKLNATMSFNQKWKKSYSKESDAHESLYEYFQKGYEVQKRPAYISKKKAKYYIRSVTNQIDVGLKPWKKQDLEIEKNRKANRKFVKYFLEIES